MKKKILFLSFICLVLITFGFIKIGTSFAAIDNALKGKIILQVESHGEAWYVNPKDNKRYYLGSPTDAFNLMIKLSTGVCNSDLNKIQIASENLSGNDSDKDGLSNMVEDSLGTDKNNPDTDNDGYDDKTEVLNSYNPNGNGAIKIDKNFAKTQAGKILLQVENHGEAWYINPDDTKRYFLGRPEDAFNLMRKLGLGVTNKNLTEIPASTTILHNEYDINNNYSTLIWEFLDEYKGIINKNGTTLDNLKKYVYNSSEISYLSAEECASLFPNISIEECNQEIFNMGSGKESLNKITNNNSDIYADKNQGIIFSNMESGNTKIYIVKNNDQWKLLKIYTSSSSDSDLDHDGISNEEEKCEGIYAYTSDCIPTDPKNKDTNSDGWWDGIEKAMEYKNL
ncbi:MAG: hypothetical protein V1860_01845 [bacterium]